MDFKVITAVATEPVSLAEARLHIKADSDTSEDTLISAWITAAREIAEHYTGRAMAQQTLEAVLDAFPCEEYIDLPRPPVASVTSIKYDDEDGTEQTLSTDDYSLSTYAESRRINLAADAEWPATEDAADSVRIRFVTGYAAVGAGAGFAACPKAVKSAILLMVAWMNENRGSEMNPDDIQPPAAKSLLKTVKLRGRS